MTAPPKQTSRWGSFLEKAVAGVEAKLDTILADGAGEGVGDEGVQARQPAAVAPAPMPAMVAARSESGMFTFTFVYVYGFGFGYGYGVDFGVQLLMNG